MVLSPNVNFQDSSTRVRLNPETYLKFTDGEMVILQNMFSDKTVQIKYDIMLILYSMVNWVTVGDLCEGWPPEDQEKIKQHLDMLYQSKIVITEHAQMAKNNLDALPNNTGEKVIINVENHHAMLRDSIRMACFERAITQTVTPESIVLDLGCGSGILSFFAARAGAKKVYAIERRPDMIRLAKELAKANGLDDRITFIENSSNQVQPQELNPRPNLLVSEILGDAILEENILELTMDARDRLLEPGASLIPGKLDIMVVAFDSGKAVDRTIEVEELETIYGFNFDLLKDVLAYKPTHKLERFNPLMYNIKSKPVRVVSLDLATIQIPTFHESFSFEVNDDGFINGFCAYFKAHMSENNVLTNSPWAPPTHWCQVVFPFPTRREVKAGETVTMEMAYKNQGLTLWYKED